MYSVRRNKQLSALIMTYFKLNNLNRHCNGGPSSVRPFHLKQQIRQRFINKETSNVIFGPDIVGPVLSYLTHGRAVYKCDTTELVFRMQHIIIHTHTHTHIYICARMTFSCRKLTAFTTIW